MSGAGKKHPAKLKVQEDTTEEEKELRLEKRVVPILKAVEEEQTVTGVVLEPESTDAQKDIYSAKVIRKAAYGFLAGYNKKTKLGLMHTDFKPQFQLVESYVTKGPEIINGTVVKEGSWIITVKILDAKIWQLVKAGKLKGFSISGVAKVVYLNQKQAQAAQMQAA